jgi:lysophospholipase L1-like esterase
MKIYLIGDSISIQYGPYLKEYLLENIQYSRKEGEDEALLDLDNPIGANGGDSSMVLTFLEAKLQTNTIDFDYLILNCGLHDIKTDPFTNKKQVPLELYIQNLEAIINLLSKKNIKLIWIKTTPCVDKIHNSEDSKFFRFANDCMAYNIEADKIMNKSKIPMIDLYSFTKKLGENIYCDHVHYLDHIREKQASFIAGWLECFANQKQLKN